jgi:hypothetical protein
VAHHRRKIKMPNEKDESHEGVLQKKLREATNRKDVLQVIKEAILEIISLKITTKVIGATEDEKLYTQIDLLQADRTNEIHINFLKDPDLAQLREFHAGQVKLAEEDIQKKLEFLETLGRTLSSVIEELLRKDEGK